MSEMATVTDVHGDTVVVVTEAVAREQIRKALVWFFTIGIFGLLSLVGTIVTFWRDITTNQAMVMTQLDGLKIRAPAPADTTRIALRYLDHRVTAIELDLQQLRRDLRRAR